MHIHQSNLDLLTRFALLKKLNISALPISDQVGVGVGVGVHTHLIFHSVHHLKAQTCFFESAFATPSLAICTCNFIPSVIHTTCPDMLLWYITLALMHIFPDIFCEQK
jgi:hypothetical protein